MDVASLLRKDDFEEKQNVSGKLFYKEIFQNPLSIQVLLVQNTKVFCVNTVVDECKKCLYNHKDGTKHGVNFPEVKVEGENNLLPWLQL